MPGKSQPFTPSSILFRPRQNPLVRALVEAPGTAPGSEEFISIAVYHHSHLLRGSTCSIGIAGADEKGGRRFLDVSRDILVFRRESW